MEYENGQVKLGKTPVNLGDATKYLKMQKRFRAITDEQVQQVNENISGRYTYLQQLEKL